METYAEGVISGTGDTINRYNEIAADTVAAVRNCIIWYPYGLIDDGTGSGFRCTQNNKSSVTVSGGVAFAYGYYGMIGTATLLFFSPPVTQYHFVYLEWNKSVLPNVFAVKTRNNYASAQVVSTSFRRDVLSRSATGVFQMPVAIVEIGKKGIQRIMDLRNSDEIYPVYQTPLLKPYPAKAEYADVSTHTESKGILKNGVTAETFLGDFRADEKVATTYVVDREVYKNINL